MFKKFIGKGKRDKSTSSPVSGGGDVGGPMGGGGGDVCRVVDLAHHEQQQQQQRQRRQDPSPPPSSSSSSSPISLHPPSFSGDDLHHDDGRTSRTTKDKSSSSSRRKSEKEKDKKSSSSSRRHSGVREKDDANNDGNDGGDGGRVGDNDKGERKKDRRESGSTTKKSTKTSSRQSGRGGDDFTDREKKIAMHAKAKREAESMYNTADGIQDMSVKDTSEGCEPTLVVEVKGKGLTKGGSTSVHAQRFDNIYSTPQNMVENFVAPVFEKSDEDVEFLLDALADNFVFNTLDEGELETLVNAFENHEVGGGEVLVRQGDFGGHFYILYSGQVAFVVDGNEVGRAVPGNSFGELALLYNAPRAATCVATEGGAGLWRVDQVTFRMLLASHTIQNDNQTKVVLRKVPFLADLDDEFVHRIADALTTVYYDAGEKIFASGSEGSVFYVIREGKVEYKHRKRGVRVLGPGDYFGEQAIVKNEPRRADATAMVDTIALALTRDVFERVLGPLSEVIARSNDRRLLRSVPIFANSDIQSFEIELMAALIDDIKYPAEKEILSEGDYVDVPALYLVRSGVLEAYTDAGESRILKSGSFFGEDTLLPDEEQKYGGKGGMKLSQQTVEVLEDCVLGKLTLANIDSVILDLSRMGNKVGGKTRRDMLQRSIDIFKLERHTLLGAGTFGQVWLASDRKTGKAYALKVQIKRELIDHHQAEGVCREREVMSKIDHPFIIKLVNTAQDEQSVFMLLNLVQGGELFNVMHSEERDCIPESEVKFYSAGILEGLAYMHRRRIIYRDLKPENVLIDELGYTVIVDLGFAKVVDDKTYTLCGTPLYLAPEVILSRGHDKGVDYWSLGCLMYEMILGQTPFYENNIDQITLFKRIVHGRYRFPKQSISEEAQDLISGMLSITLTQRLGCLAHAERDIKGHPFMRDINFGKLGKRMLKAPWVPQLTNPLDASCFESWDHLDDKEKKGSYKRLNKKEQDIFVQF